jgi:uncharacterized cupin superfamily protein
VEDEMPTSRDIMVSRIDTDEWVPDPDVPGTEMHELVHDGDVWAGMSRILTTDGPISWTPEHRETIHVLEGSVRIELDDGRELELGEGDLASFPAGTSMRWHVRTPFKELWFMA